MTYFETELVFIPEQKKPSGLVSRSLTESVSREPSEVPPTEVLGITLRLGNQPLVYNLQDLTSQSGKPAQASQKDNYLIVHAISAIRTHGKAKVEELQYFATALEPAGLQTIDLIPKTRFNEVVQANLNVSGSLDLAGETSLDIPASLSGSLLSSVIDIGGTMKLQLSTDSNFIGRFTFSVQIPIVQSGGTGSNSCSWVLNPDEKKTPLLGDQVLIQSISVPAGCKQIRYTISAAIKADKGIFWKQQEKKTPDYTMEVDLNSLKSETRI